MDVIIKVLDTEKYGEGFPPEALMEFQQWVNARVLEVPEEYRHTATIQWWAIGESCLSMEIKYRRPETVAEQEARIQTEQSRREARDAHEKLEYLRLCKKFEGPGAVPQALRVLREIDSQVIAQVGGEFGDDPA